MIKENTEIEKVTDIVINRWQVLEVLYGTALSKPDLESSLDVSRSTVNRAVSELHDIETIKRSSSGKYQITAYGQLVYHLFSATWRSLDGVNRAKSLSSNLPAGKSGEVTIFDGATIAQAAPHEPDRALRKFLKRTRDADFIQGYSPVMLRQYVDTFHEQAFREKLKFELIITTDVRECLETTYTEEFKRFLHQPEVRIFESKEQAPYGLTLFTDGSDREACLLLYSETGVSGFLTNTSDTAVGWAQQLYRSFKAESTRIDSDYLADT